jgi:hypothetical protein
MLNIYIAATIFVLGSMLMIYLIAAHAVGRSAGLIGAILYGLYQADLFSCGLCPNFESWAVLPALAALAVLSKGGLHPRKLIYCGILLAVSAWMKQTTVFFSVSAAVAVVAISFKSGKQPLKPAFIALCRLGAGFLIGSVPFFIAMGFMSCLKPMFAIINPFKAGEYIRSADASFNKVYAFQQIGRFVTTNKILFAAFHGCVISALFWKEYSWKPVRRLVFLFLLASLMSVFSGGRFFNHYFIVVFPFLCLYVALFAGALWNSGKIVLRICVALFMTAAVGVDSLTQLNLAWLSAKSIATKGTVLDKEIFIRNQEAKIDKNTQSTLIGQWEWNLSYQQIAGILRSRLGRGETIWSFDYVPEMYFYTKTYSPTRHQENFEFITSTSSPYYGLWHNAIDGKVAAAREELMTELRRSPPRFIIRIKHGCRVPGEDVSQVIPSEPMNIYGHPVTACKAKAEMFEDLSDWVKANYRPVTDLPYDMLDVYEPTRPSPSPVGP